MYPCPGRRIHRRRPGAPRDPPAIRRPDCALRRFCLARLAELERRRRTVQPCVVWRFEPPMFLSRLRRLPWAFLLQPDPHGGSRQRKLRTYQTKRARCPNCGAKPNRASYAYTYPYQMPIKPKPPRAGDIGVCWNCAAVNIYTDHRGSLRRPTPAELAILAKDSRLAKLARDVKNKEK